MGGYIFGSISDKYGRKAALVKSVKWAIVPAIGFAVLPGYDSIGVVGSYVFVILRLVQGVALGGEYAIAGTYLMEMKQKHSGLVSCILVGSCSVGSLIGFGFAFLAAQQYAPASLWRWAFLFGAAGTYLSYYGRHYLIENYTPPLPESEQNGHCIIFI